MYLRRLKDLREDKDQKQIAIAELLNITRQQYSLYETGKRDKIGLSKLSQISSNIFFISSL